MRKKLFFKIKFAVYLISLKLFKYLRSAGGKFVFKRIRHKFDLLLIEDILIIFYFIIMSSKQQSQFLIMSLNVSHAKRKIMYV